MKQIILESMQLMIETLLHQYQSFIRCIKNIFSKKNWENEKIAKVVDLDLLGNMYNVKRVYYKYKNENSYEYVLENNAGECLGYPELDSTYEERIEKAIKQVCIDLNID